MSRRGFYVEPTIISGLKAESKIVQTETFAPIVYIFEVDSIDEAIFLNNNVNQGLSSSIFTENIQNVFRVSINIILFKNIKIFQVHILLHETF